MKHRDITLHSHCVRILFAMIMACSLVTIGCGRDKGKPAVETTDTDTQEEEKTPQWDPENGLICILFGYGFNGENFYTDAIAQLKEKYGLADEGGIILPVIFFTDTDKNHVSDTYTTIEKGRISNLYSIIAERKIKGIILLGAPDGTHRALARIRNNADGDLSYSIFSFMPQDDILGQESNCNFVLEYERSSNAEEEASTEMEQIDKTAEQVLIRAVRYMEEQDEPLAIDPNLHAHVQAIVGERKVRRYIDSETGLQAINHFVMEQPEQEGTEGQ